MPFPAIQKNLLIHGIFKVLFLGKGITNSGHCSFLKQKLLKANNEKDLQNVIANFFERIAFTQVQVHLLKIFF